MPDTSTPGFSMHCAHAAYVCDARVHIMYANAMYAHSVYAYTVHSMFYVRITVTVHTNYSSSNQTDFSRIESSMSIYLLEMAAH